MYKRIGKILGITILVIVLLLVITAFLLTRENVQNKLAKEATAWLSKRLDTKVSIDKVKIDFLHRVHFMGLYVEDKKKDTLVFIHDFNVNSSHIASDLWNNKTSIIKNVRLVGGVVNLNRAKNSDEWNFAFIEQAFATDKEDSTSGEPPKIDLKNVKVSNVRFAMLDKWAGQDIVAKVGSLDLKVNGADFKKSIFNIKNIDIQNSDVSFKDYEGGKPRIKKRTIDKSTWGSPFNSDMIAIILNELDLKNVNFEYQMDNHQSKPGLFDERHIVTRSIQLDLEDLKVVGDTITADIINLSTQERCGLNLKRLSGHVLLNHQLAEITNLYLETNRSVVRDYYSMRYKNFHDFNEYITNVSMYGRFKNSTVDKRDIAFFSGEISQLPVLTKLNAKVEGTVDNIYVPEVHAIAEHLNFKGSGRIVGLPNVENTFFDLYADKLVTTGNEILRIAPEAKTDAIKWAAFSKVDFKGDFKGTTRKFNADGLFVTNQGKADIDIFMNLEKKIPSYSGRVNANHLNLGEILNRNDIGRISAQGTIEGEGFDFDNLIAKVDAQVNELNFDGIRYENLSMKGDVRDKKFNGIAKSRDEKLGFDFEGFVDLSSKNPSYDFKSNIIRVNLKLFGITENDVFLKARVNLDFKGKNIDDFVGKTIMQDVVLRYDNEVINIPKMRLNSFYTESSGKVLDLQSSVANARVEGQYSITGIGKTVLSFLHYYIPTYIKQETLPENEKFKFNLIVKEANKIIQIFEPKLKVDSGSVINGDINTTNQSLHLVGLLPSITYDGVRLTEVGLKSNGNRSLFDSEIIAGKFFVGNSEVVKDLKLDLEMSSDTMHFNLKTNPVDDFLGQAVLDGKATAFNDRLQFEINPSTFIIKDDKYRLFSYHPIQLTYDQVLLAKDVLIQNGNQQLIFNASHDGITNDALLETQNLDLEKISKYINSDDLILKGRVNSKISAKDIWGSIQIAGNANTIDYLRINNDTLGAADINFQYDGAKNILTVNKGSKVEHSITKVNTDGYLNFDNQTLNLSAKLDNMPISFVNQYIIEIIDSLKGSATGDVSITGPFDNPTILGDLLVKDAMLKINFTGCTYTLDDVKLKLNQNAIVFDPITIYDERAKPGKAILSGSIGHSNYDTYRLKLKLLSDDILGLKTDDLSGELFYGYIPSKVDMDILGSFDDVTMNIKAEPLTGSEFYLPLEDGGDVGSFDFIKFRTLGRFQDQKPKRKGGSYFKVNMDINATPKALATIILDPNTQEKIEARGNGNISVYVDLGNEIRMRNTYTVKEGIYKFNFRGLLSKDFDLEEGGTITWNGNPYQANLNMAAVYKTKVSLYPLIKDDVELGYLDPNNSSQKTEISQAKNSEDTYVSIDLTGPLSKPTIVFDITQPNNKTIGSTAITKLQQIRQDQNELIYQAGMILLFNSFKPSKGGLDGGSLAETTTLSTASDLVGSALSQVFNSSINKLGIPNLNVNVDYKRYSADVTSGSFGRRDQVNLGVQGSFFNDRFLWNFGNSLDFADANAQANGANKLTYGGDFRGQYLLTLDGRYRLNAFRVSNYDYVLSEPITKGGVGLTYKRSFNKWNDLFGIGRRKNIPLLRTKEMEIKTGSIKKEEPPAMTTLDILSKLSF